MTNTNDPGEAAVPAGFRLGDGWRVCDDVELECTHTTDGEVNFDCREPRAFDGGRGGPCAVHAVEMGALVPIEPTVAEPPGFRVGPWQLGYVPVGFRLADGWAPVPEATWLVCEAAPPCRRRAWFQRVPFPPLGDPRVRCACDSHCLIAGALIDERPRAELGEVGAQSPIPAAPVAEPAQPVLPHPDCNWKDNVCRNGACMRCNRLNAANPPPVPPGPVPREEPKRCPKHPLSMIRDAKTYPGRVVIPALVCTECELDKRREADRVRGVLLDGLERAHAARPPDPVPPEGEPSPDAILGDIVEQCPIVPQRPVPAAPAKAPLAAEQLAEWVRSARANTCEYESFWGAIRTLADQLAAAIRERDEQRGRAERAEAELDQKRVQLAGASVAALGCTEGPSVARQGDWGWSVAYEDTLRLRRNYDAACIEVEQLRAKLEEAEAAMANVQRVAYENGAAAAGLESFRTGWLKGAEATREAIKSLMIESIAGGGSLIDWKQVAREWHDKVKSLPLPPCPEGPPAGTRCGNLDCGPNCTHGMSLVCGHDDEDSECNNQRCAQADAIKAAIASERKRCLAALDVLRNGKSSTAAREALTQAKRIVSGRDPNDQSQEDSEP